MSQNPHVYPDEIELDDEGSALRVLAKTQAALEPFERLIRSFERSPSMLRQLLDTAPPGLIE
jgi:hypothetical protein